jgi:TPR repeat protein
LLSTPASRAVADSFPRCYKLGCECPCEDGDGQACLELGNYMYGFDRNAAAKLYARACERGEVGGCLRAGGAQASAAPERADKLCGTGDGNACNELAAALGIPTGESKLDARGRRAFEVLEAGCRARRPNFEACHRLAKHHRARQAEGDVERARELYRRAPMIAEKECRRGVARACAEASALHAIGRDKPRNPAAAARYRKRAEALSVHMKRERRPSGARPSLGQQRCRRRQ